MKCYLLIIALTIIELSGCKKVEITYSGTVEELKSDDFEMFVNNQPNFVYEARVSKYPINQVWPGYQRPMYQTEIASFTSFDLKGETVIKIISKKKIETLDIRPKIFQIEYMIRGEIIEIKIRRPQQFVVEVNGYHNALHVFANPPETSLIDKMGTKVHYFGPGVHDAGIINMKSNETVFIEEGAIVYGTIKSEHANNIKILGRGILDASKVKRGSDTKMIFLNHVKDAYINGIILRDSPEHTVFPVNCDGVIIDNIKLIGMWRYNSDGIDPVSSRNVTIKNCFIRTFDDNIAIKGVSWSYSKEFSIVENIVVDNCVLWNDWGRPLEIGAGTVADTMRNILFTNCYILHFTFAAMSISNDNRGHIKDVSYRNIYIEEPILDNIRNEVTGPIGEKDCGRTTSLRIAKSIYSTDTVRGNIDNIHFENIRYNGSHSTSIYLSGYSKDHIIKNIFFKNYYINDAKVLSSEFIIRNEFVENILVE